MSEKGEKQNILKLSKPIMINGKEVKELTYDFDNMTAKDKINVGKKIKKDGVPISVEEIDSDYHLYLFAAAVTKADPSISYADVLRMNAKDGCKGAALARDFFYMSSEE